MHGRQNTSCETMTGRGPSAPELSGDVRFSFVAPKMATTFAPTAPARCIAPESFDTTARASDSTPASDGRSVFPLKSISRLIRVPVAGRREAMSAHADRSAFEPTIKTIQPRSLMIRSASCANRSGSHCLARP